MSKTARLVHSPARAPRSPLPLGAALLAVAALAGCAPDSPGTEPDPDTYAGIVFDAAWASDMVLELVGDELVIEDDGLPDHAVLEAYALMNDATVAVSASSYSESVPAEPAWSSSSTDTNMGVIGVMVSGGRLFNPYEGDGTSVALDSNFDVDGVPFIDACSGHPLPDGGTYHYHGVPWCVVDQLDTDGEHSVIIGVLLDGFPVYGPQGEGGAAPSDLDACSGHDGPTPEFPDGLYHYHLTDDSPYSINCYHGEVTVSDNGGPPGGGPPA